MSRRMAGLVTFCLLQVPGWAAGAAGIAAAPLPAAAVAAIPAALEPAARGELLATGSTSAFFGKQAETGLCPNPAAAADLMRILGALHPNIGIQALVAAAMPGSLAARADRDLRLYNLMHQFHTMEGIPYFSATHGEMRTFFTASNVVNGPEQRTAQKDPEYPAIQPSHGFFVEQDDTTFGKNLYAVTVKGLAGGAVELTMTNVEPVRYGVLQVLAGAHDEVDWRGAGHAVPFEEAAIGSAGAEVGQMVVGEQGGFAGPAPRLVGQQGPGLQAGQDFEVHAALQRTPGGSHEQQRAAVAQHRDRFQDLGSGAVVGRP
jgi:hypothetical protein